MKVRKYTDQDLQEIVCIWNEVVEEGVAFPQEETLDMESILESNWSRIAYRKARNLDLEFFSSTQL